MKQNYSWKPLKYNERTLIRIKIFNSQRSHHPLDHQDIQKRHLLNEIQKHFITLAT